jgi:MazG family protein
MPRGKKNKTRSANKVRKTARAKKKSARRHFSVSEKSRARKTHPTLVPASQAQPERTVGLLFENLVALQARLRAPGGCPWDRQQTHDTLQTYLIEETYEVLDALQHGGPSEVVEELGDLLLQVLFHADIAREAGSFDIAAVITGIHDKMVRRHPHVFGNVRADTPEQVLKNWGELKAAEKADRKATKKQAAAASVLDGVPRSLPAVLEAYQLSRRAARVGFDWPTVDGVFEKLQEETVELQAALEEGDSAHLSEEVGDLLFVAVNLARFLKIDPEVALKAANSKFKTRFMKIESMANNAGRSLERLSQEELEQLWQQVKQQPAPNSR